MAASVSKTSSVKQTDSHEARRHTRVNIQIESDLFHYNITSNFLIIFINDF